MNFANEKFSKMLARVRHRVYRFLIEIESRYEMGEHMAEIFESYRDRVDRLLSSIAPDILAKFSAVYRAMKDGHIETRSQAILSCRRILKAVADYVYPAQKEPVIGPDGNAHDVGADNYTNRLWQFVSEAAGKQKSSGLLRAQIGDVEQRFECLVGIASKGVHSQITLAEANQCAIQTYLVAGDVLWLYSETMKDDAT